MSAGLSGKIAVRLFGKLANKSPHLDDAEERLRKARIPIRADVHLATAYLGGIVGALLVPLLAGALFLFVYARLGLDARFAVLLVVTPGFGWYLGNAIVQSTPGSKAKARGKQIDARLSFAANYIAAMAGAGIVPSEIFRSLSKQEIYGAVAQEAAWIYKDMEWHGMDVLTAMRRATKRTPSDKFQDLMQGAITAIASGGDLTAYFRQKAARLQWENRVEQRSFIETMGIMAESYVTAAVAGPLFLLVMIAIFVLMGSATITMMRLIIFLLLPIINLGFIFGLHAMTPET